MDPEEHAKLLCELESVFSDPEIKEKVGSDILRRMFLRNPSLMNLYKPLQSSTLPQAMNSTYVRRLAVKYVDSILELVRNYNSPKELQKSILILSDIHRHRGITVAHFMVSHSVQSEAYIQWFGTALIFD
ncbi:unnamed protein product [Dicrocoelium dendriticum]|nr:unnamed protein product [Dicrocoelium dendriticum]